MLHAPGARSLQRQRARPSGTSLQPRLLCQLFASALPSLLACSPELPEWDEATWHIASTPADGANGVDRRGRIVVAFDRLPLANSIGHGSVDLRSGSVRSALDLRLQPLTRELWIDVRAPLEPEIRYELELRDLLDLDAQRQPKPYRARFETGVSLGEISPDPELNVSDVLALLAQRCGRQGCHGGADPLAGLDLGSAAGIEITAKNVPSAIVQGSTPRGAGTSGLLHVAAPLRIDTTGERGEPARSYLIFKLLGPDHILGDVMPPPGEPALSASEIQQLCDWIYAGAPTQRRE